MIGGSELPSEGGVCLRTQEMQGKRVTVNLALLISISCLNATRALGQTVGAGEKYSPRTVSIKRAVAIAGSFVVAAIQPMIAESNCPLQPKTTSRTKCRSAVLRASFPLVSQGWSSIR